MKDQTPEEIIKFGGVASALRDWCARNNKTVHDINRIIGKPPSYTMGYHWLNGKGAPGAKFLKILSKGTGIPEEKLMRHGIANDEVKIITDALPLKSNANSLLSFTVNDNGEARIKLDVTLPIQQAAPLFRMILDAGIIMEKNDG